MSKYNDKVEFVEAVCDTNWRMIQIIVKVPYNGELTDCYASAVYDDNGMRSMSVHTLDQDTVYEDDHIGVIHNQLDDSSHTEDIERLLNKQL